MSTGQPTTTTAAETLAGELRLADGRRLWVRPVQAQDAAAEQALFGALSPRSRQLRFHVGLRELPPDLLHLLTVVDPSQHVALLAWWPGDGSLVADARYVRLADPAEAEFAVVVADAWQRQGIGSALLARLRDHAAAHGVQRLVGDVLPENQPMARLVQSLGGRFVRHPDGPQLRRALFEPRPDP